MSRDPRLCTENALENQGRCSGEWQLDIDDFMTLILERSDKSMSAL